MRNERRDAVRPPFFHRPGAGHCQFAANRVGCRPLPGVAPEGADAEGWRAEIRRQARQDKVRMITRRDGTRVVIEYLTLHTTVAELPYMLSVVWPVSL